MKAVLVANPRSAGGATAGRRDAVEALARRILDAPVRWTDAPGAGSRLAREARAEGFDTIVAVGGDGTISEVTDGIVAAGGGTLGIVPSGTGGDLARALGLPRDPEAAMRAIRDAVPHPIDALRVELAGADGPVVRHGINISGLGMAGDVVARVNAGSKVLGGRATFAIATLRSLLAWHAPEIVVRFEDAAGTIERWTGRAVNLFVCNARQCGGGMLVAPDARMDDGLLDVVLVQDRPLLDLVRSTPRLYDGTIAADPKVMLRRVRSVAVERAEGAFPVDLDGEAVGAAPVVVRIAPHALSLRAPRSVGIDAVFGVDPAPET